MFWGQNSRKVKFSRYVQEWENEKREKKENLAGGEMEGGEK